MAWVVPEKDRAKFEGAQAGTEIDGSKLFAGLCDERVKAIVARAGKCKQGRFYECNISYLGIDLGSETFVVKEVANG